MIGQAQTLAYAPGIGWRPYAGHLALPGRVRVVLIDIGEDMALPVDERHSFVLRGPRAALSEGGTA